MHGGLSKCRPDISTFMSFGARCKSSASCIRTSVVLLDTGSVVDSRNVTFETESQSKQISIDLAHGALKVKASTADDDMPTPWTALKEENGVGRCTQECKG